VLKLIIEDDEGHASVVPLDQDEITIGRKEGNTVQLTDRNISRQHARLIRSNSSLFIEDLDSYNGVKVNGNRITARTTIRESDRLDIGDYHLSFQQIDEEVAQSVVDRDNEITGQVMIQPSPPLVVAESSSEGSQPVPEDQFTPPVEVAPSEDTTSVAEEVPEDIPVKESLTNRKIFLAFGALVAVVLIGISAYLFMQAISTPSNIGQDKKVESISADVVSPAVNQNSVEFQIGMDRFQARDYDAALKNFEAAVAKDPGNDTYKSMREQTIKEKDAASSLNKLKTLISNKNWDQAVKIIFPPDTIAAKEAAQLRLDVEDQFKTSHLNQGQHALEKGRFSDAIKQSEAVLTIDEGDITAQKLKQTAEKSLVAEARKADGGKISIASAPVKNQIDFFQINKAPEPEIEEENLDNATEVKARAATPSRANAGKSQDPSTAKTQEPSSNKTPEAVAARAAEPKTNKSRELQEMRSNALKLFGEGKLDEAIVLFQKVLKTDPGDCALYRYLGTSYVKIGDKAKAYQAFRKFVEVCPNDMQAPMVRDTIERYEKE
jgi:tetratricopeptide (TPR) repeat protein